MSKLILCSGEALYDFISKERGKNLGDSALFEKRVGGSPLNVAIGLVRLGAKVGFMTKLSTDSFGKGIYNFIKKEGITTDYLTTDNHGKTTLAFVSLMENGKPDFEFYREDASDTNLKWEDIQKFDFSKLSIFHFGSIAIINGATSETLIRLFEFLKGKVVTSFDPNVRPNLIDNKLGFLKKIYQIAKEVDILKMSDDDARYIFGTSKIIPIVNRLERRNKVTIITYGKDGSVCFYKDNLFKEKSRKYGEIIDTTGCGDAYMAGFLYIINESGISKNSIRNAQIYGTIAAGIVATKYGGADSMPYGKELDQYLREENIQ